MRYIYPVYLRGGAVRGEEAESEVMEPTLIVLLFCVF